MKYTIVALAALLSLSTYSYYEDNAEVQELASAGEFTVSQNSAECKKYSWQRSNYDLISSKQGTTCADILEIPVEIAEEVAEMKTYELENNSDYDERITAIAAFKNNTFRGGISLEDLRELTKGLNIKDLGDVRISAEMADESTFSRFDYLFLGYDGSRDSRTQKYLVEEFSGKLVQTVEMTTELPLYPGGGFNVTHFFFVTNEKIVYVKLAWWNS